MDELIDIVRGSGDVKLAVARITGCLAAEVRQDPGGTYTKKEVLDLFEALFEMMTERKCPDCWQARSGQK